MIPAFNARDALELCLLSLGHCARPPGCTLEVVVVDDGSTDGTGELVTGRAGAYPHELQYVFLPRTPASGRASARNAGIAAARGELIVMIDADQLVPPRLLAEHVRFHRLRADLVVLGPRLELGDGPIDPAALATGFDQAALPLVVARDSREVLREEFSANFNNLATCWHYLYTCNVSVRREHLLAVGGLDASFVGWGLEDSELGFRLRRRGLAFAYNPEAGLYHRCRQEVTARMYGEWRRNLRRFVGKHPGAAEVSLQAVVGDRDITWPEAARRFEYAARALHGRLPRPPGFALVEVDDAGADAAIAALPGLAAGADVLVLDHTAGARLSGVVQCTDTARELHYFHRPPDADRARILARHGVRRAG
ncbi:glycosyltransferase [Dactylosporangium sp. NPDC051484]|uniref:glycosyltransferase n=1 Tax=Dactylosporangium sp. NPDC051484 TaxID=3154942 RepID=UPI00344E57B2